MKTGILFDLDGTLLNSLDDLADSLNFVLKQYNCPTRTVEQVRQAVGNGARRLVCQSLPGREDDPPVEQVLETYQKYYADHCRIKTRPYDGIATALEQLKKLCPIAIVSNKPDVAVKALCADYFPGIYALGETEGCPRKPAPDMVKKAMAHIGVDRCIYVGDSDVDVCTAKNAGVPCVSVLWGFRDRACIAAAGGNCFCDDPDQLVDILTNML